MTKFGKGYVEKQIEEIKNWAFVQVPGMITTNPKITEQEYLQNGRLVLNIMVIQTLMGAEFEKGKNGEWKTKFTHKLPDKRQVAEIVSIMNTYIETVEEELLNMKPYAMDDFESDDMEIPDGIGSPLHDNVQIARMEKINTKKVKNLIFGYDGQPAMCKVMLNGNDIIQIAAMGEELRKVRNRNKMLIIGGITLLIAGGVGAAVYLTNKNHDDADVENDVPEIDTDDGSIIDVDDDDAPIVDLDDDAPMVDIA